MALKIKMLVTKRRGSVEIGVNSDPDNQQIYQLNETFTPAANLQLGIIQVSGSPDGHCTIKKYDKNTNALLATVYSGAAAFGGIALFGDGVTNGTDADLLDKKYVVSMSGSVACSMSLGGDTQWPGAGVDVITPRGHGPLELSFEFETL